MYGLVAKRDPVRRGDLIVYPGIFDQDQDPDRDVPGHIAIIVRILAGFVRGGDEWWEELEVVHCSPRKQATLGAIRLTDATQWASRGYIVRPLHYVAR